MSCSKGMGWKGSKKVTLDKGFLLILMGFGQPSSAGLGLSTQIGFGHCK